MLNQLTKYLLQYRRVSIPSVGTIQLVQQPASLNMADKVILPPTYTAELREDDTVPEHQLRFLSYMLNKKKEAVLRELQGIGHRLSEKVRGEGFEWKGIGLIRHSHEPIPVHTTALSSVAAERVFRQDATHSVLVGDQQLTSQQASELAGVDGEVAGKKRSVFMIIGWILLVLSILFIIFILYQGKFRVGASGSKLSPTGSIQIQEPLSKSAFLFFS